MRGAASVYAFTHDEELYAVLKSAVTGLLDVAEEDGRISSYSRDREFCKGILADMYLNCYTEDGVEARLDTTRLRYLTAEHQPLRLRDKLYVTFDNGASGVFYNRDTVFTVGCLDGTFCKLALNRIRHIVF